MKYPVEIAALVAAPILVACCVAPAFMAGLAATSLGWVAGFSALELMGLALVTVVLVLALMRFGKAVNAKSRHLDEGINNE